MTDVAELRPGRPAAEVTLEWAPPGSPHIVPTHVRVGEPHKWRSVRRSPQEWAELLADPERRCWLIKHGDDIAGILHLRVGLRGDVEIDSFGLVPEYVGKGIGGHALTLAIRQAWAAVGPHGEPARRVWLHTSTLDHPHALTNYKRRGFRPFYTRTRELPG
ncbi:GNAT family N-acetyltransferase [Spongiactinospora rosea]|uniref:GNAT family N-acetyltransferase n=2 Tax=Spongiactinospora rosea TaxID=2248750 RepID=A0A366LYH2_9ACTN|nr:GNAT family N-acetyltransferase [Spongiactinospora rosea]